MLGLFDVFDVYVGEGGGIRRTRVQRAARLIGLAFIAFLFIVTLLVLW